MVSISNSFRSPKDENPTPKSSKEQRNPKSCIASRLFFTELNFSVSKKIDSVSSKSITPAGML